ncbi:pyridine nucleotide-disulfide oxidoreductase family protein [Beauveria bassiana ARSEF 2860]|uniref:Pyridine nucleotide-disulfide oxidoreductase family protein n=1 Tax=Beauveria bassiana (strain ARSEF 2860) TaxID=655819 RepID=J4UKK5_BEAB2|nr:pyridine nucleotide-disulfide oxidoreductase family protein [Beauveria bassiana ARSEF 2860]EJP64747.1 pyridine nucleotide-disulfide oxidoreductase family protein [Beauveria bassiana ARSEF 2860]
MPQRILIIGTGFAGLWSALSAKRLVQIHKKENEVEIVVVAPQPSLVVRPRLYEDNPSAMIHDLEPLFQATNIAFVEGFVEVIDTSKKNILFASEATGIATLGYDRLILAAGSSVVHPRGVDGLSKYAFDIDSITSASTLDLHLKNRPNLPPSKARDTVVVCGAGFTGIELATELPSRIGSGVRIVLVDGASEIGAQLGPGPRPAIARALDELGIEVKLGSAIASIDKTGVTLRSGERIDTLTAVWTAGVRATPLTQQIAEEKDELGRVRVDATLRVPSTNDVFVTGDAAHVLADPGGNVALMCCQHALLLGRVAGYNAAADLIQIPNMDYSQEAYNCCLDLGGHGAVICRGWQREEMRLAGDVAKRVKRHINRTLIYPPTDAAEALAAADPDLYGDSDALFSNMIKAIQGTS